ncbi:MAG TPA: molybdopterin-dependent oxidoreductase [Pseudonocardiaceae bacterium]|nr:molybdopterin-dependent oxidoreductase [Pseudonocardiaceae bacterium]
MRRPLRHLSLLAAGAALVVAALTGAVAVGGASVVGVVGTPGARAAASTTGVDDLAGSMSAGAHRAPGSFEVTGNVAHRLRLGVAGLQALPSRTVEVTFQSGTGVQRHVYTGPRLFDVLALAGARFDPQIKSDKLRHFVSVTASDGYRALVAYGEIDPDFEGKDVLLATTEDGRSLAAEGPRLVVPGDSHGGRYVTGVVRVFLQMPQR